ncbi:MAG: pseudouridine synthase [Candidatus Aminicenantes bacterium]|nr:pseudouridine synthase [Candidatus Aminicenantes bacterium]
MILRLNRYLSMQGVASRREADRLIGEGRVQINGRTVEDLGVKVDDEKDRITLNGRAVKPGRVLVYLALNKPAGYLVTRDDPEGRPTVMSLLPKMREAVFPIGRLDLDSEGLLLLTNDGDLAYRLTHPRFEIKKIYSVEVDGEMTDESAARLEKGIRLDGRRTAPGRVRVLRRNVRQSVVLVEIHEGRKREVRRMMETVGHRVRSLKRVEFAGLTLAALPRGQCRPLKRAEVRSLRSLVGLT